MNCKCGHNIFWHEDPKYPGECAICFSSGKPCNSFCGIIEPEVFEITLRLDTFEIKALGAALHVYTKSVERRRTPGFTPAPGKRDVNEATLGSLESLGEKLSPAFRWREECEYDKRTVY